MRVAAVLFATALGAGSAHAQRSDDRQLVYVDDVETTDKALLTDAAALTTALCAAIGKDARIDVLCAPDVKQILSFAATSAMIGNSGGSGGPAGAIQERLDRTRNVVSARLRRDGGDFILVVTAGPKAADAQATALYSDKPTIALEEKADAQRKVLERLPALAARITAALVPSAKPSPAPPAPIAAPAPAKASSGW